MIGSKAVPIAPPVAAAVPAATNIPVAAAAPPAAAPEIAELTGSDTPFLSSAL